MEFEKELLEKERIDKAAVEFDEELQIEEDATLAAKLSTLISFEGKKKNKKKKSRHHLPKKEKEPIAKDARVEKKKNTPEKKKRKREEGGSSQPFVPLPKKRKGKEKVVEAPPQVTKGKKKIVEKIPIKAKGKEKVTEESSKKDEGKGRRKQFPDLLLEMSFFLEEAPLQAYILDIIDHHG